jgi:hypothetical protein
MDIIGNNDLAEALETLELDVASKEFPLWENLMSGYTFQVLKQGVM